MRRDPLNSAVPLRRLTQPTAYISAGLSEEEMATPTAFLCSGAASYTTGETIRVAAECAIIIWNPVRFARE